MLRRAFNAAIRHPTSLVFLFVAMAGLVLGYARADPPLTASELIWITILSGVYLFSGTVVFMGVLREGSPGQKMLYLAFQIGLGFVITYLERGNGLLLLLPLASHSVALFSPREAALPCVIITAGIALNATQTFSNWVPFVQSFLVFGSAVFFAAVFTDISIRDARRKEQVERLAGELERANQQLQAFTAKSGELAAAEERNRLAREIHDGLGHYLTTMKVQAELARTLIEQDADQAEKALSKLEAMIGEALGDVRRSVAALRSEPILGSGLLTALEGLVDESRAAGLATELYVKGERRRLAPAHELTLYRAVQEGLTNVRKHAQARQAKVMVEFEAEAVRLRIEDDGAGSRLEAGQAYELQGSFGLLGLRERAQILGGDLRIRSTPEQGFCLEIELPTKEEGK